MRSTFNQALLLESVVPEFDGAVDAGNPVPPPLAMHRIYCDIQQVPDIFGGDTVRLIMMNQGEAVGLETWLSKHMWLGIGMPEQVLTMTERWQQPLAA